MYHASSRLHQVIPESRKTKLLIASEILFLSQSLGKILSKDSQNMLMYCDSYKETLSISKDFQPDVLLLDARLNNGLGAAHELHGSDLNINVIVFGMDERAEAVLNWAEAGIVGYISNSTPLTQLQRQIEEILCGRQRCSQMVAAALLHRFAIPPCRAEPTVDDIALTRREREVLRLLAEGMQNKEIARDLDITLATTKAHVHNLMVKLKMRRRGEAAVWRRDGASFV